MNVIKYLLKIKRRIRKAENLITNPISDVNNPFSNVKPKTYVWIDDTIRFPPR